MPNSHYEHIERYLNGELSPADTAEFEQRLAADSQLREDLRVYQEVHGILSKRLNPTAAEQQLREQLRGKRTEYFQSDSGQAMMRPVGKRRFRLVAIAAVAAVLFVLWWAPWQENILKEYGQIEMTAPTVRGAEQDQGLVRASALFNNQQYKKALPFLDSAVQAAPADSRSRFYRGVTLLHLHQASTAQADFQPIFEGQSVYRYKAAYFMAIAYWQMDDKDSCRLWLQRIPPDAAEYPQAQKMREALGR